ncbi:arylsulfatase A-like enzyme [Runella defluvii]|uniref:Arylsulfatase A-like enzyme n=1 Tax=Runella defluvii TaxID=370973 RepID=A0A7W5ZG99_9BACT|nr:arylsulfatase [Runella defluvii]MBB3836258.1 arylsulfatase A-like enzyme [Runella defluvii]
MRKFIWSFALFCLSLLAHGQASKPNVIIIYADDLGYGDVSCYGAKKVATPNIDRLAKKGVRFTNAHTTAATCTPSRYSLLTGEYAWRKPGTGVATGDAAALILPGRSTLPLVFQQAGYQTGVVGKWHLGLGPQGGPDWNGEVKPSPLDIGFHESFIMAATGDRVPCVYVDNRRVVNLDPNDPIKVSFKEPIGNEPTGRANPELLKMKHSHGHDFTIINGIGRIGYMTGGKSARWKDEDMADIFTQKAVSFIENHAKQPFFLYFATQDIHVPRVPHERFAGKSGMGPRGDVILQLDWAVGKVLETLDRLGLSQNTMIVFSSDNGPVVDDGYQDQAVELLSGHTPAGPLRGGKYSAFDAGTRVPFIVSWPQKIKAGVSPALVSQIDLLASFASLTGQTFDATTAPDTRNYLPALLGKDKKGRDHVIEHAGTFSVIQGDWKYIAPSKGAKMSVETNTELGNDTKPQLYNLKADLGEQNNLAETNPAKLKELEELLKSVKELKK